MADGNKLPSILFPMLIIIPPNRKANKIKRHPKRKNVQLLKKNNG